jgi:hypothetical protein
MKKAKLAYRIATLISWVLITDSAMAFTANAHAYPYPEGIGVLVHSPPVDDDHDDALKAIKRGEILSYDRIRSIAERELGGKMVGERLRRTNRGWVYEIRVRRNDGKVVFAIINAGSGKIVSKR